MSQQNSPQQPTAVGMEPTVRWTPELYFASSRQQSRSSSVAPVLSVLLVLVVILGSAGVMLA